MLSLLLPVVAVAASPPQPPCAGPPEPSYAAVGVAPLPFVWHVEQWAAPGCLGWTAPAPTLLVALAGSFRFAGTVEDLVVRFGAVSTLRGIRYWSVSDRDWMTLVTEASALGSPDPARRRADFSAAELTAGTPVFFAEHDNRTSGLTVYRMRVLESAPERLVVTVDNASPVRRFLVTLFDPGELQTTYFLQRLAPGVWGYFALWGIRTGMLTGGHEASSVNRAVAIYRHFVGIPTDLWPPGAQ